MCSVSHKLSFLVLGCADRPYRTKTSESRIAQIAIPNSGPWRAHGKAQRCPNIGTRCHSTP
eukprot:2432936-Prymnesium_polylepis.1